MRAVIFDTETTGLVGPRTLPLDKQPHVIEFYGQLVDLDDDGKVLQKFGTLIKPPIKLPLKVKGDKGIADITGITETMLANEKKFESYAYEIKALMTQANCVIAHNLSFDIDMVEIEFARLKDMVTWPARSICTVEQTMHLKGHRLTLSKLYALLFNGATFEAHRAVNDVEALTRVCVELRKRDIL